MLVMSNVLRLRCWFRISLTVNQFELRNRNRSTVTITLCTLVTLLNLTETFRSQLLKISSTLFMATTGICPSADSSPPSSDAKVI